MTSVSAAPAVMDPASRAFYRDALGSLDREGVDYLVGGAYSFSRYTGIERHTKDFDIFVRQEDAQQALDSLARAGYLTEFTFPHWLGKAFCGESFVDVMWFTHSTKAVVLDIPVLLCPVEETIWSKAFVMERERYDGADIAHLLRGSGREMDWQRLLDRFGPQWRVLLAHLVMFGFIYPSERDVIPDWILGELMQRLGSEMSAPQ